MAGTLKWTFGLINSAGKYLTAEKFQSKVNCNGVTMKKKQIWTMEQVEENVIALKSSFGLYLTSNKNGDLSAGGDEIGGDEKFTFETQSDGKVAIKSVTHGRFIGGSGDQLSCFAKEIDAQNLYTIQLAMHPQINLRNVNRKTYVHLEQQELRCNEEIPWGYDAMLILEFYSGKYALRAADTTYLSRTGQLVPDVTADTLFTLFFRGTQVSFQDSQGKFLTAVGATGTLMSRKTTIGKDELFTLEDSHPQVRLIASNGKYVSTRDKVTGEVRANQGESTDAEIFQMEAVDRSDRSGNVKWAFHSSNKKYWHAGAGSILIADQDNYNDPSAQFVVEWMGPMIALKGSNGKYVSVTSNGKMTSNKDTIEDNCKYVFEFINRPILVLRGEYGFVGVKGASGVLECNRSQYDVFGVEGDAGTYKIKGANGKYWMIEGDSSISVNGATPVDFFLELRAHTHMCIMAPNGQYVKGQQNGGFTATGGTTINGSVLWEY
jgi:fascin 1/2